MIDGEQQKVSVSGNVDSTTLVKKLLKCGKHAELWSHKINQNQKHKHKPSSNHDMGQKVNNLESFNNIISEEDGCYLDEDDDEFEAKLEQMQLFRNQIALLNQQAEAAHNAKKGMIMNNDGGNCNSAKKGNQNQVGAIDPRTLIQMNGINPNHGNDINSMMNLAGFHGNAVGGNILGGNPAGAVGGGFPVAAMNVNGYNQQNPMMMMNRQPQMMYNRSGFVAPTTAYYSNYGAVPVPVPAVPYEYGHGDGDSDASRMFSDENASSCAIM